MAHGEENKQRKAERKENLEDKITKVRPEERSKMVHKENR